jgi:hypothetical protein
MIWLKIWTIIFYVFKNEFVWNYINDIVPRETSPKLDIFEIQYYTIGWIERDFVLELRVAWGLKNWVLVPVNPFRNIFVFGLG